MYLNKKMSILSGTALLVCALLTNLALASTQQKAARDPLGSLKRALTEAGAPALTTDQETQITAAVTAFRAAQPDEPSEALQSAKAAFDAAILAGDLAEAQKQAGIISGLIAANNNAHFLALAKFATDVRTILSNGGQLTYLTQKFAAERVVGIIESLVGHGGFGGGGRR